MKRVDVSLRSPLHAALALVTLAALSASCSSATSSADAGVAAKGQLTMKVNGVPWVAAGRVVGAVGSAGIGVTGNLDEAGTEQLTINLRAPTPGTYVADKATKSTGAVVFFNRGDTVFSSDVKASTFTVVVTKASGVVVEGTFSGTFEEAEAAAGADAGLAQKLVITEGKFATVETP
ncbi:MAG TPA: hypothetical protein PLR99_00610 [Polyangiaceae bacterium]|nr:hypothetical protein [Polyangiaceae bacterium]